MKRQDIISILITFVTGLFIGGFLYLTEFSFFDKLVEVPVEDRFEEFVIVGDVYGSCEQYKACPSFQILSDGSYRYYHLPQAGQEQVLRKGVIPLGLQVKLKKVLKTVILEKESRVIQPSLCNSYTDGIDIKYKITLNADEYEINSCGTDVDGEGELWTTLSLIWDYFERG